MSRNQCVSINRGARPQTLGELLEGFVVLPKREASIPVSGLTLDSRRVASADRLKAELQTDEKKKALLGNIFIALPKEGPQRSGKDFIGDAVKAGAGGVITEAEEGVFSLDYCEGIPVIGLPYLSQNLSTLVRAYYGEPSKQLNVIGVTGTNGKTTCCHLLAQLCSRLGIPGASIGTLGYGLASDGALVSTGLTTPNIIETQSILSTLLSSEVKTVAMEVSSHALKQDRVQGTHFDAAIFTNLTRDHLDYHGTMEAYASEKKKLLTWPGIKHLAINIDDTYGKQFFHECQTDTCHSWSYSLSDADAHVRAADPEFSDRGIKASVITPWGEGLIKSCLLGEFNLSNLLAVITILCAQGIPLNRVLALIPALKPVRGRMEQIDSTTDIATVVDFAHTPEALKQVSLSLKALTSGKLWVVFGCGGDRDKGKRAMMGAVAGRYADRIVITSDNPRSESPDLIMRDIVMGIDLTGVDKPHAKTKNCEEKIIHTEVDRSQAIHYAIKQASPGDCVLIAGKGHENYQETGAEKLFFCDKEQALKALKNKSS